MSIILPTKSCNMPKSVKKLENYFRLECKISLSSFLIISMILEIFELLKLSYKLPCVFHNTAAAAKSLQSCLTLCLPASSIHGIFQARVLEWVAIAFSIPQCYWHLKCYCTKFCLHLFKKELENFSQISLQGE